jgi:hypothetical protein
MPRKKSSNLDDEAIARKAYELWAARGFPHGDPEHDWYEAERHLRSQVDGKKGARSIKKTAAKKTKARKTPRATK